MIRRLIESIAIGITIAGLAWIMFQYQLDTIKKYGDPITTSPMSIFRVMISYPSGGIFIAIAVFIFSKNRPNFTNRILLLISPIIGFGLWALYTIISLQYGLGVSEQFSDAIGLSSIYRVDAIPVYGGYICAAIVLIASSFIAKPQVEQGG